MSDEQVAEPQAQSEIQSEEAPVVKKKGRLRRLFRLPKTQRGIISLAVGCSILFAGVGGFATWFYKWSESAQFCTTCHTMQPEKKAYHAGTHADVECGECHVAPGVKGWVTAKIGGMYELYSLVTSTYPEPITAPEHGNKTVPSPTLTCMKCHQMDVLNATGNPVKLVFKTTFMSDEQNSKQVLALALRPPGIGSEITSDDVESSSAVGVHNHISDKYQIFATDLFSKEIPLVEYKAADGSIVTYMDSKQVTIPSDAQPDIDRVKASLEDYQMDCIDCHNRVGHDVKSADTSVDEAMATGQLPTGLPWLKRDAVKLIEATYPSAQTADTAIDRWAVKYKSDNGITDSKLVADLATATSEIKAIYHQISTPHMRATAAAYPTNMGHKDGKGCFRCHDGAHVKIVDGKSTGEMIPSSCNTCHTFPQQGKSAAVQFGNAPESHKDKLWTFNHKTSVSSVSAAFVGESSCKACHAKPSCESCHASPLGQINHDSMAFTHADKTRGKDLTPCATCHTDQSCARCHGEGILKTKES